MNIEDRMENAILDLREALANGDEAESALVSAAKAHDVLVSALKVRVAPSGDLDTLQENLRAERASKDTQQRIEQIIRDFDPEGQVWFKRAAKRKAALEDGLGRPITSIEERFAEKFDTAQTIKKQQDNVRYIRSAMKSIPREHDAAD